jgi:HAD superfamily hydrolase (TIGR01509 family)
VPRAVLWDLDGTLVDSRAQHWQSWRETMARYGITITEQQCLATFGQRNDAILGAWLGTRATPDFIARVGDEKEQRFRELVTQDGVTLLPGAEHWVRRLATEGWAQAIASSAPLVNVEVTHRAMGLGDAFQALVSAEDVRAGKPNPAVFLIAARRVHVPPERCVVVEDAAAGIDAARRAGMRSIAVGGGAGSGADVGVASLADLGEDAFDTLVRE